jgi:hypothetical protein
MCILGLLMQIRSGTLLQRCWCWCEETTKTTSASSIWEEAHRGPKGRIKCFSNSWVIAQFPTAQNTFSICLFFQFNTKHTLSFSSASSFSCWRKHLTVVILYVGQARATHVCLDCGYIYTLSKPFEEQVLSWFLVSLWFWLYYCWLLCSFWIFWSVLLNC